MIGGMPGKQQDQAGRADREQARREQRAREQLGGFVAEERRGSASLPPSAVDLLQASLRRSGELTAEEISGALALLPAARAEVEGLEAGVLFTARAAGQTWAQIAEAMGFKSPQACQQHYNRLVTRQGVES
jgi:hypothetical protein